MNVIHFLLLCIYCPHNLSTKAGLKGFTTWWYIYIYVCMYVYCIVIKAYIYATPMFPFFAHSWSFLQMYAFTSHVIFSNLWMVDVDFSLNYSIAILLLCAWIYLSLSLYILFYLLSCSLSLTASLPCTVCTCFCCIPVIITLVLAYNQR